MKKFSLLVFNNCILSFSFLTLLLIQDLQAKNHFPITNNNINEIRLGKNLYKKNCISCHLGNLSGAKNWKVEQDKDGHSLAPPLNGTGHTWHHSDKLLHGIIKNGLGYYVKGYEGKMGAFGNVLSDKDIDHTLSYIKSYWNKDIYSYQIKLKN